ncbi:hypothetical protein C8Q74DRAFT_1311212 [Fomes fomentarius]|nr:hypothetical protein C8Q74DRAFT_1311212 [Fomes fomentarius]
MDSQTPGPNCRPSPAATWERDRSQVAEEAGYTLGRPENALYNGAAVCASHRHLAETPRCLTTAQTDKL